MSQMDSSLEVWIINLGLGLGTSVWERIVTDSKMMLPAIIIVLSFLLLTFER